MLQTVYEGVRVYLVLYNIKQDSHLTLSSTLLLSAGPTPLLAVQT